MASPVDSKLGMAATAFQEVTAGLRDLVDTGADRDVVAAIAAGEARARDLLYSGDAVPVRLAEPLGRALDEALYAAHLMVAFDMSEAPIIDLVHRVSHLGERAAVCAGNYESQSDFDAEARSVTHGEAEIRARHMELVISLLDGSTESLDAMRLRDMADTLLGIARGTGRFVRRLSGGDRPPW